MKRELTESTLWPIGLNRDENKCWYKWNVDITEGWYKWDISVISFTACCFNFKRLFWVWQEKNLNFSFFVVAYKLYPPGILRKILLTFFRWRNNLCPVVKIKCTREPWERFYGKYFPNPTPKKWIKFNRFLSFKFEIISQIL